MCIHPRPSFPVPVRDLPAQDIPKTVLYPSPDLILLYSLRGVVSHYTMHVHLKFRVMHALNCMHRLLATASLTMHRGPGFLLQARFAVGEDVSRPLRSDPQKHVSYTYIYICTYMYRETEGSTLHLLYSQTVKAPRQCWCKKHLASTRNM